MVNNTLTFFNAPPCDSQARPADQQGRYYEHHPAEPSKVLSDSGFATMTYDDPTYQQFLNDWPLFLADLNPEYFSGGPQQPSAQVMSLDSLNHGCLMSAPLDSGPAVEVVGDYYNQPLPSNPRHHATTGIPLENRIDSAAGAAPSSVLWSPNSRDTDILANFVEEMKLGNDLIAPPRSFQIQLPPTMPAGQPPTCGWAGTSEGIPTRQKGYAGGRAVAIGSHRQHQSTPYDHGLKDQWWLREEPPITALHVPASHSSTNGLSYEDTLVSAGTHNQASPKSTTYKNNNSNGQHPLVSLQLHLVVLKGLTIGIPIIVCPAQGDFKWPSPAPSALSSTGGAAGKGKKRLSDARRSKAQMKAKTSLKNLFPESTCNQAEATAIKVIRYIMTTGDVPRNVAIVEDWWRMANGLEQGYSHTLRHAPLPRTLLSNLSDEEKKSRQKELKRAADRLRNGTRGALTSELREIFGPCTNLQAFQRASDYLVFAKLTGRGGISLSSTYWHGRYACSSGPFFPST